MAKAEKAELEGLAPLYLESLCERHGLAGGTKAQMVAKLVRVGIELGPPEKPNETEPVTEPATEPVTSPEGTEPPAE